MNKMANKKDKFLLVSLEESKTKKIAQVISNPTCHKILDFLAEKESTETEISKKLNLPISTVHYNLKQLIEAKLIEVEEFHYSSKGREVNHYKLANKYIIIAPKQATIGDKLKKILPIILICAVLFPIYKFFTTGFYRSAAEVSSLAAPVEQMGRTVSATAQVVREPIMWKFMVLAFIAGMIITLITIIIAKKIRKK